MDALIRNIFVIILCLLLGGIVGNKVAEIKMENQPTPNLMVFVTAYKGGELVAFDFKSFEFTKLSELTKARTDLDALNSEYVKVHTFIYYK